jgi:hypothetical protein
MRLLGRFCNKKEVILSTVALATVLALWYDERLISSIKAARRLSLNLGDGNCLWQAAIQHYDNGFPTNTTFRKTIIAGYPSGDKRITFKQLEGLTGLSARDEWDFMFLGSTNQPFIKANYPHHEGIWGWGDVGDQVVLVVSELKKVLVEYHDILWVRVCLYSCIVFHYDATSRFHGFASSSCFSPRTHDLNNNTD